MFAGSRRIVVAAAIGLVVACDSTNVIGPGNQLQVTNATDDFQFQVSALSNVSQTLQYNWVNTGDSASINQASSLSGGAASLTIRGPAGTVVYQSGLQANGTFHSQLSAVGTWVIVVALDQADGAINFRVQKAP